MKHFSQILPVSARLFRLGGVTGLGVWLLLLATTPAQGQSRMYEVLPTVGYGPAKVSWRTLNEFFTSYSAVNQKELVEAPALKLGSAWSAGATVFGCVYLGVLNTKATAVGTFKTGAKRHVEARNTMAQLSIEPRFWIEDRVFLGPIIGASIGPVRTLTYYEYPDGTESWGRQRRLSGTYSAVVFSGTVGAKVGVNLGPTFVQIKAEYLRNTAANAPVMYESLPGSDSDGIPRNYDQFLASDPLSFASTYSLIDDGVRGDMSVLRVALEIGFRINPAD